MSCGVYEHLDAFDIFANKACALVIQQASKLCFRNCLYTNFTFACSLHALVQNSVQRS